jgi:hypothetical protein
MGAKLRQYGWLFVVAIATGFYIWKPLWPHAVAPMPIWPFLLTFVAATILAALRVKRHSNVASALSSVAMITFYFYFEHLIYTLSFAADRRTPFDFLSRHLEAFLLSPSGTCW